MLPRKPTDPEEGMFRALASGKVGEFRKRMPEFMAPRIKHLTELYPVTVRLTTIAGVPAVIATPVKPIPKGLDADAMAKWLPPNGFTGKVHQIDAKVGGTYKMSFTNFTTGHSHSFGGECAVDALRCRTQDAVKSDGVRITPIPRDTPHRH